MAGFVRPRCELGRPSVLHCALAYVAVPSRNTLRHRPTVTFNRITRQPVTLSGWRLKPATLASNKASEKGRDG